MFQKAQILSFYTDTPLHAGAGGSVSWVDLPIQREKHTNLPIVQGSGIKGALRDWATQRKRESADIVTVFGPEKERAHEHGGCLSLTDARLLLMPVRSFAGVFAWVTCKLVLERFLRDLRAARDTPPQGPGCAVFDETLLGQLPTETDEVLLTSTPRLKTGQGKVVLEDAAFTPRSGDDGKAAEAVAAALLPYLPADPLGQRLSSHLAIVSNDAFRDFAVYSTEIVTRIAIDQAKGTVQTGALWTEELLPTDTVLYCLALAAKPRKAGKEVISDAEVLPFVTEKILGGAGLLQLGGDETVGRGLVRVAWRKAPKAPEKKEG
ncbi:MAG: type III-B CRISPR module RAMP protein Cmr4 [Deltaproteobacteria bacterium]|nr:type III-B CRISPR module RAMP protein Cmr4 [Deltaproteobacteria bacterium]